MTPGQLRRLRIKEANERKVKPIQKISNTFLENTIQNSNISALKTIWYISTVLEQIEIKQEFFTITVNSKQMLEYTGLTAKDIRTNLKAMQKTSIDFTDKVNKVDEFISLLPKVNINWGKNTVELTLFSKIAKLIVGVKRDYSFINTKHLMMLKNKHSIRLLPVLQRISQYSDEVGKRKHLEIDELNELFGTNYKRFTDIERKILAPVKEELDNNSKLSFLYEINFDNFGKGRPKAVAVTIDLIIKKSIQRKLI